MEQQQPGQPGEGNALEPIGEQEPAQPYVERVNEARVRKLGEITSVYGGEDGEDGVPTQDVAGSPAEIRSEPMTDTSGRLLAGLYHERRISVEEAGGWLDEFKHAADHLVEVRDEILSAYHDGRTMSPDEWQLAATLNAIAGYVDHLRTALTVMRNGGLRETGNERWFTTDGATDAGPYLTLVTALASMRELSEEGGDTFIVYEQEPDPTEHRGGGL